MNRLAMYVVQHARLVLVAALLAVIGMGVLGGGAFAKLEDEGFEDPGAESARAAEHYGDSSELVFLARSAAGNVDEPEAKEAGLALTAELRSDPAIANVVSYWEVGAPSLHSGCRGPGR